MKLHLISIVLIGITFACSKDEAGDDIPELPLVYESLIAEKNIINAGETTKITATAEGFKIEFHWSATGGDILGSGQQVTYTACPCYIGTNQVSCTISDGYGQSETKKVTIIVQ